MENLENLEELEKLNTAKHICRLQEQDWVEGGGGVGVGPSAAGRRSTMGLGAGG